MNTERTYMPHFRKKSGEFPAIKFTGDNYKVVETWGTAFGVPVCQFISEPGTPYVCVDRSDPERPLWERVPANTYIMRRWHSDGWYTELLDADRFEDIYEEAQ